MDLSQQRDRGLRPVLVYVGHVHVIDEVDEGLVGGRTVVLTTLLLDHGLDVLLQGQGVSEGVEVDGSVGDLLRVGVLEVVLNDGGLSGTSSSDKEDGLVSGDMQGDDVIEPLGEHRLDVDLGEAQLLVVLILRHDLSPVMPLGHSVLDLPEVVEYEASFRISDLGDGPPLRVEVLLIFLVVLPSSDGSSDGPHASELE